MVDRMNPLQIGVNSRRCVSYQRIFVPTVPQFDHYLDEFLGSLIAVGVRRQLRQPKIRRRPIVLRGHDIPGRSAPADMIERSETARHMERMLERRRSGRHQPCPLGHRRHRGQHERRIQRLPRTITRGSVECGMVCKKHRIECAALRDPRDFQEARDIRDGTWISLPSPGRAVTSRRMTLAFKWSCRPMLSVTFVDPRRYDRALGKPSRIKLLYIVYSVV